MSEISERQLGTLAELAALALSLDPRQPPHAPTLVRAEVYAERLEQLHADAPLRRLVHSRRAPRIYGGDFVVFGRDVGGLPTERLPLLHTEAFHSFIADLCQHNHVTRQHDVDVEVCNVCQARRELVGGA